MAQSQYEYKVTITTLSTADIPSIGMLAGVMTWTPEKYPAGSPTVGILGAGWISPLKKSANVAKGGNYAITDGGTLSIAKTAGLMTALRNANIRLIGARLEIHTHDGTTETKIYNGVIGVPEERYDVVKIPFESSDRLRNVDLSQLITDSDTKYGIFWGSGKHKLIKVESDEITTEVPSKGVAAFSITSITVAGSYEWTGIVSLRTDYSAEDEAVYDTYLDSLRESGYTLSLATNGVLIPFSGEYIASYELGGKIYRFPEFTNGNIATAEMETDGIATIVASKRLYMADFFDSDGFQSEALYTFGDSTYTPLAKYSDPNIFDVNSVNVTNLSGVGYTRLAPERPPEFVTDTNKPSWLTFGGLGTYDDNGWWHLNGTVVSNTPTGSLASTTDGDINTNYQPQIQFAGPVADDATFFFRTSFGALQDVPDKLLFTGDIDMNGYGTAGGTIDNISVLVWIDHKYDNAGPIEPISDVANRSTAAFHTMLGNYYPKLDGVGDTIADQKPFRWDSGYPVVTETVNGFTMDLIPILSTVEDWSFTAGFNVYVALYISSAPDSLTDAVFKVSDVSLIIEGPSSDENLFADWDGRDDIDGTTISDTAIAYTSAIQLQNLENLGFNDAFTPAQEESWLGWGKQYPTLPTGGAWTDYLDDGTGYGGINRTDNDKVISYQVSDKAFTGDMKADLCRIMVGLGTTDRNGIEKLFHLADGLYNTDGTIITLHQLENKNGQVGVPDIKRYVWTDVYSEITVTYAFDAGRNENSKTIVISKVDKDTRDTDSVSGVTSTPVADELWNRGRQLYLAYGGYKNEFPSNLRDYGWLTTETDVIQSIEDFYAWQGVETTVDSGITSHVVRERYTAEMELDMSFVLTNSLDMGSKIRLDNPFRRGGTALHSGIITAFALNPINFKVAITAHMAGDIVSGGDSNYIIEDESNTDTITEDEANTDTITEGA